MNLDNYVSFDTLDINHLIAHIRVLPDQIQKAWEEDWNISPLDQSEISQILICGVGTSFTAAKLLKSYLEPVCLIPIHVTCGFELPAWASNNQTLLIISGFTGNEIELQRSFSNGIETGVKMVVIAQGGKLIKMAKSANVPYLTFQHAGPSRTAIGFEFILPLAILCKSGFIPSKEEDVYNTLPIIRKLQKQIEIDIPVVKNPAKRMAGQFINRWVTLFGAGPMGIVAERWKSQINENAKAWAQVEKIPAISHSTINGLYQPEAQLTRMMALFLQSSSDHPLDRKISEETRRLFMVEGINTDVFHVESANIFANIFSAIQFGDYLSYYLAMAYEVDPTPLPGEEEFSTILFQ
ncbi:MAG TPA: SIS domain-containing protein [Leptolinea sp.]